MFSSSSNSANSRAKSSASVVIVGATRRGEATMIGAELTPEEEFEEVEPCEFGCTVSVGV